MTIEEIKEVILPYIDELSVNFEIERKIFDVTNERRKEFNKIIRQQVPTNRFGVYVWVDKKSAEIVYIGMAGKIKQNGSFGNHSIQKRLLASRGKELKKDISTNAYVERFMKENKIDVLDFFIMYSKEDEPPAYIEALMLYNYYKKNKKLPKLNNSF